MDLGIAIPFLTYLAALILVGLLAYRKTTTFDDFYLAGRKLGSWVTALSAEASSESGWLLLGLPGQAFSQGLGAFWVALGCVAGTFFNWTGLAPRLRKVTGLLNAITIPDYFAERFNDRSGILRIISALLIAIFMTSYVAAQFVASGKALGVCFGIDYKIAAAIGSGVILFYTMMGGFFAVAWTDVIQAILMVIALVVMPVLGMARLGGWDGLWQTIACATRSQTSFVSLRVGKEGIGLLTFLVGMIGIGLGYPGQPHILTRFMAIKSTSALRKSALVGVIWAVIALYGAVLVGLVAKGLLTDSPADPERVMPMVAVELLPAWLAGIVIAAIMAAIMSTADSQLLVVSSAIVQDFYHKTFKREPSPRNLVLLSRVVTLAIGLMGLAIALGVNPENPVGVVFWLVLYAWGGLASSFGPVLLLSLYWRRTTRQGAIAGMISGSATVIIWKNIGFLSNLLYELVPGFLVSLLVTIVVSWVSKPGEVDFEGLSSARLQARG